MAGKTVSESGLEEEEEEGRLEVSNPKELGVSNGVTLMEFEILMFSFSSESVFLTAPLILIGVLLLALLGGLALDLGTLENEILERIEGALVGDRFNSEMGCSRVIRLLYFLFLQEMDYARRLLDELMGTDRNKSVHDEEGGIHYDSAEASQAKQRIIT